VPTLRAHKHAKASPDYSIVIATTCASLHVRPLSPSVSSQYATPLSSLTCSPTFPPFLSSSISSLSLSNSGFYSSLVTWQATVFRNVRVKYTPLLRQDKFQKLEL
jgi:hypothetical protein